MGNVYSVRHCLPILTKVYDKYPPIPILMIMTILPILTFSRIFVRQSVKIGNIYKQYKELGQNYDKKWHYGTIFGLFAQR